MNQLKKIGISILYVFSITIIGLFLITLLNYFNIANGKFFSILKILVPLTGILVGGIIIGKRSEKKGWLEGLKLSLILIITLILLNNLIFKNPFKLKILVYYSILIITSIFGSVIGINFKKQNE